MDERFSIKITEGVIKEFFFQACDGKDESCDLKLDTDDNQVSHKITYCFVFTNSCTLHSKNVNTERITAIDYCKLQHSVTSNKPL